MEATGHVLAGIVHNLDGVAGQVRRGGLERRIGRLQFFLALIIGRLQSGICRIDDGRHLLGGQRLDLLSVQRGDHLLVHRTRVQQLQVGRGERRTLGVGHAVGLIHACDLVLGLSRHIHITAHEHVAGQVVEVVDALGIGAGPQLVLGDDEATALVALAVVVGIHVIGGFDGHRLALVALHLVGVVLIVIVAAGVMSLGADHLAAHVANDVVSRTVRLVVPRSAVVLAHIGTAAVAHAVVVDIDVRLLAQHLVTVGTGHGMDIAVFRSVGEIVQVQAVTAHVALAIGGHAIGRVAIEAGFVQVLLATGVADPVMGTVLVASDGHLIVGAARITSRHSHLGVVAASLGAVAAGLGALASTHACTLIGR